MNTLIRWSTLVATVLLVGCATTHPKEEPVHEQGWIGGRYQLAKSHFTASDWVFGVEAINCFPPTLEHNWKAGILTDALGTNTPAFRAGLREGDLILEIARQPVTRLHDFWGVIRATPPGATLPVKSYREGKILDFDVTVGREKFRHQGTFMVGLPGYWPPPHPIPTRDAPNFSLVALGWQRDETPPVEFDSVGQRYRASCHPKDKQEGDDDDWRCWLAIFQVVRSKKILAQEPVATTQTAPAAH